MKKSIICLAFLMLAACNTPVPEKNTPTPPTERVVPSEPEAAAPVVPEKKKVELQIESVGETMTFNKTALTIPAGSEVHLTLKNNGKSPLLPHNWVLVKPGTEAAVALEGLEKGGQPSGYVVPGANVLAFTPLALHGDTTEVTFTAPEVGKYPYICTVPGHYVMMKGVLTVTAQ